MKISELIQQLQNISDNYGDMRVEVRNPTGYATDAVDVRVCIDHQEIPYARIES